VQQSRNQRTIKAFEREEDEEKEEDEDQDEDSRDKNTPQRPRSGSDSPPIKKGREYV
jgi:hypothetical protein